MSLDAPLEIRVRDWGAGFDPRLDEGQGGEPRWQGGEESGLGRAVIAAFADDVLVRSAPGAGTDVRLRWDTPALFEAPRPERGAALPGDTVLSLFPDGAFAAPAIRVLSALASRARLPVDRFGDLQLIGEAVVTPAAPALVGSHLSLAVLSRHGRLQVTVGPFVRGGSESVRRARTVGGHPMIDRLADDLEVLLDPRTEHEALVLGIGRAG